MRPYYLSEVFGFASNRNIDFKNDFKWLKHSFLKSIMEEKVILYIHPSTSNIFPESIKRINNPKILKNNVKKHYLIT